MSSQTALATSGMPLKVPRPADIIRHCKLYVVGQDDAIESLAIAIRRHYALQGDNHCTREGVVVDKIDESHVLIIGPTGSGKTLILETIAKFIDVPFSPLDATKCSETGYVGDNVENALLALWQKAGYDLEKAQRGIVYIDEIDKLARKGEDTSGRDVSGQGVQRGLLSLLHGIKIRLETKGTGKPDPAEITFDTSKVLFVCSGAFEGLERIIESDLKGPNSIGFAAQVSSKEEDRAKAYDYMCKAKPDHLVKFGMMRELIGRFGNITATRMLTEDELFYVLKGPRNCPVDQQKALHRDIALTFQDPGLRAMAGLAYETGTGARGLKVVMGEVMKPTELLLPQQKVITLEDVTDRERLLLEARKKLAQEVGLDVVPERGSAMPDATAVPVLTVFKPYDNRKERICEDLTLPIMTWEVGTCDKDNRRLTLLRTKDDRSFWQLRLSFGGNCACGHRSVLTCQWIVPYRKGVDPISEIGQTPNVNWICQKEGCGKEITGHHIDLGPGQDWGWEPTD